MDLKDLIELQSILVHPAMDDREKFLKNMADNLFPEISKDINLYRIIVEQCGTEDHYSVAKKALLLFYETDNVKKVQASLAILEKPVTWEDGNSPVSLIFMIVHPKEKPNYYLEILSQVSRTLSRASIFNNLIQSKSAEEAYEVISHDNILQGRERERREKEDIESSDNRRDQSDRRSI